MNAGEKWIWTEWKWLRDEYTEARLLCDIYGAPEKSDDGEILSLAERISALLLVEIPEPEQE